MKNLFIPSSQPNLNLAVSIHEPVKSLNRIAILCPGYLDTKDYSDLLELGKDLSGEGYIVVRFDPLGTWQSDGSQDLYSLNQYQDDITTVKKYMLSQYGDIPIVIGGKSLGGMMSIAHATQNPDSIYKVFGIVPPHGNKTHQLKDEWRESGYRLSRRASPNDPNMLLEFKIPYQTIEEIYSFDLLSVLPSLKTPLLLIAAGEDTTVTPDSVEEIYEAASGMKEIIILSDLGHDYRSNLEHVKLVNKKVIDWLKGLSV